jgi:hypothetical protein
MNEQLVAFCGLFMGEGCALLARRRMKSGKWTYRPELIMRLRSDDRPVLDWVYSLLGGGVLDVCNSPTSGNPMSQWWLAGYRQVQPVLQILLQSSVPAKKKNDILILDELCTLRKTWPYRLSQEHLDILEDYRLRIQAIRHYQSAG